MKKQENLPGISDDFIKAYIKAYNDGKPITEVQLEVEELLPYNLTKEELTEEAADRLVEFKIKTRGDNTVIIHPVKDKFCFPYQDVENIIMEGIRDNLTAGAITRSIEELFK